MKEKLIMWIVWKLPPRILLWAVIRGFADATSDENGHIEVGNLGYGDVYDAITKKYKLKD